MEGMDFEQQGNEFNYMHRVGKNREGAVVDEKK